MRLYCVYYSICILLQVMRVRPMTSPPGSVPRDWGRHYPLHWHMHTTSMHWECRYVGELSAPPPCFFLLPFLFYTQHSFLPPLSLPPLFIPPSLFLLLPPPLSPSFLSPSFLSPSLSLPPPSLSPSSLPLSLPSLTSLSPSLLPPSLPPPSLSPSSLPLSLPPLQECSVSDKEWTGKIKSTLKQLYNIEYEKVATQTLWGIRIVLLVKPEHSKKITHLQCTQVRTGIGKVAGE